ncbi:MAG TPA: hypothetical protein P5572_12140 [Phycisphaerae bacterium]|nr:hypothetical protein [Phycisphaerae bacterium]
MQATSAPTVMSPRRRGRRKTVFINPGFQWRYAALVAGGVFVVALLMCTVMYGVLYDQARARLLYLAPAHALENTVSLVLFAGVFAGVMAAAFGLWAAILSQRICGPLYVMEGQLKQLAEGRIPHMRALRRNDEFKPFYASLCQAMEQLRQGKRADLDAVADALELIRTVQNGPETVRPQALGALRDRLEAIRAQSASALGESTEALVAAVPASPRRSVPDREPVGAGVA